MDGRSHRIVVNGLVVDTFIGVHDFERDAAQRVRFAIEIDTVDAFVMTAEGTTNFSVGINLKELGGVMSELGPDATEGIRPFLEKRRPVFNQPW